MKRSFLFYLALFMIPSLLTLEGCTTLNPYRPEIHQGNIVTPDVFAKLRSGMTSTQVQAILGTPVVGDIFQPQKWEYIYYQNKRGETVKPQTITLWFEKDALIRWVPETLTTPTANTSATATGKKL